MAKMIRKMHVPAYAPVEFGVHDLDHRAVLVEVVKNMAMLSIEESMELIEPIEPIELMEVIWLMALDDVVDIASRCSCSDENDRRSHTEEAPALRVSQGNSD